MFTSSMYITLLLFKISYYFYFSEFFKDIVSHVVDLSDLSAV